MTIELEKKEFKINNNLKEQHVQNIIEGDVIVPDTKPDIMSIVQCKANVMVISKETHKDMIVVRGKVAFKILYISDDPSRYVCNINHDINFDQIVDAKLDISNIKSVIDFDVEHVDSNILNGRKINVKAILNCNARIINDIEVSAVCGINGLDNIQMLTQPIQINREVEMDDVTTSLNFDADIPIGKPAIKEILRTNAAIKDKDIKITGGKAIIKGNIEVKSLYVPDMNEGAVDFVNMVIPFSEVVDVDEVDDGGMMDIGIDIADVDVNVKSDEDGDLRVLNYDVSLSFKPKYIEKQDFEVVIDAYSVSSKFQLERNSLKVNSAQGKNKSQFGIKDIVSIAEDLPQIKQIYNVDYNPIVTGVNSENDKVMVDGIIELKVLYTTESEEKPVQSFVHEIPFHNTVELKGANLISDIDARVEMSDFIAEAISQKDFEIKGTLITSINVYKEESYNIIIKVDEIPLDERAKNMQPSMTVYYVQDGDNLWNIAKKYYTTTKELVKINNINNPDLIQIGQQLLIPKMN